MKFMIKLIKGLLKVVISCLYCYGIVIIMINPTLKKVGICAICWIISIFLCYMEMAIQPTDKRK